MFKQKSRIKGNEPYHSLAPVGGLDGVSPLMGMPENRCILMENWFPQPNGIAMRDGFVSHMTDSAEAVLKLHVYAATTGAQTLWASTDDGIYAATTEGPFGVADIAITNGLTISTTIATGAGNYMMVANGVDTIKQYDGTTWTSIATFGGTATSVYSYVETYRQRLFLVKKNSLEIEYLSANAISGAATNYPLGAVFRQGGYIIAIGTWTLDGGTGSDDQLVIVTNKGEVAVFAGNDPATWEQRGVYAISEPIGASCLFKYGGDLLIITENGVFPLSGVVQSASIDRRQAVSENIKSLFRKAAISAKSAPGWEILVDPLKPLLLVNIPASPNRYQFVMNTQTRAWTVYKGWDARCFARMNGETYFGTETGVKRVNGHADEGTNITATMLQAFTRMRYPAKKKIELQKPYISTDNGYIYYLGAGYDFADPREVTFVNGSGYANAAIWGISRFGEAVFTGQATISQDWHTTPDDYSLWKAPYLQVVSRLAAVEYYGSDFLFLPGGSL